MKKELSLESISDSIITEKRPKFGKELRLEFKKWSEFSTAHGIAPSVNPTNRIFRIIWLLCLLGSLGVCIYMVNRVVTSYFNWDVVVTIIDNEKDSLEFPAISICNINPFVTPEAFVYLRDYYNINYNVNIQNFNDFARLVHNKTVPYETDWIFYQTFDPNFNQSLLQSFGYSAQDRVKNCLIDTFTACYSSDFVWFYSPIYGNCYKFNSGYNTAGNSSQIYSISREGSGLSMQVFSNLDDTKFPYMFETASDGIVLIIDDQQSLPIKKLGILNPNDFIKISISKTITRALPAPYSNCQYQEQINTVLSKELNKLNIPYSRSNCMTLCEQMQIIQSLGCYDMRFPPILNARPCRNKSEFFALNNFLFDYTLCYDLCPYECVTIQYDASTSYGTYPSYNYYVNETLVDRDYYSKMYRVDNITFEEFQKGVAKVFIYYENLKYTEISSSPEWDIMDLIANIGGTLGLFLGVSLLSFVEFVELAYQMIRVLLREYIKDLEIRKEFRQSRQTNF